MWTSQQLLELRQQCREDQKQLQQLRREVRVNFDGTFVIAPTPPSAALRRSADTEANTIATLFPADSVSATTIASGSPARQEFYVKSALETEQGYDLRQGLREAEQGEKETEDDNDIVDGGEEEGRELTTEEEIGDALREEWEARDEARLAELEKLKARVAHLEEEKTSLTLSLSYMCDYKGNWGRRGGSASSFTLLEKRLQELVLDKVELERKNARLIKRNKELQKVNKKLLRAKVDGEDEVEEEEKSRSQVLIERSGRCRTGRAKGRRKIDASSSSSSSKSSNGVATSRIEGFHTPQQRSSTPGFSRYSSARPWYSSSTGMSRTSPTTASIYTTRLAQLEQTLASEKERSQLLQAKLKAVSEAADEDRANFMSLLKEMKRKKGEGEKGGRD